MQYTRNVYSSGGSRPSCALDPISSGRTYMLAPLPCGGTYAAFRLTARCTAFLNRSTGTAGMLTYAAECCMRSAFCCGRKIVIAVSSGVRNALSPS